MHYFAIYDAIICKEADTRLNVFVYVVDVQQEEYRSQNGALWDTRCNICDVRQGSIKLPETRCLRFDRKDVIQLCVLPVIPYEVNLDRRRLCGTLSKVYVYTGLLWLGYDSRTTSHDLLKMLIN